MRYVSGLQMLAVCVALSLSGCAVFVNPYEGKTVQQMLQEKPDFYSKVYDNGKHIGYEYRQYGAPYVHCQGSAYNATCVRLQEYYYQQYYFNDQGIINGRDYGKETIRN